MCNYKNWKVAVVLLVGDVVRALTYISLNKNDLCRQVLNNEFKNSKNNYLFWGNIIKMYSVCNYVYEGDINLEADDYKCPICKQPKSVFKFSQVTCLGDTQAHFIEQQRANRMHNLRGSGFPGFQSLKFCKQTQGRALALTWAGNQLVA